MSPRRSRRSKLTATSFSYESKNDSLSSSAGDDSDYDGQSDLFGNILGLFVQNIMRRSSSGGRRRRQSQRKTPAKKRPTAGPCCGQTHCAANMFGRQNRTTGSPAAGTSGLGARRAGRGKKSKKDVCAPVLSLDSDDDDVKMTDPQKKGITSKIDNFFKEVESSDDDFEKKFKKDSKDEKPVTKNSDFYTILSDDEADDVKRSSSREDLFSQPSVSGIDTISLNNTRDEEKEKNKEDLFAFVDDIINDCDDIQFEDPKPKNGPIETLEDLKKKTEEILGSVSTLIEEFNPNKKTKKTKSEDPPEVPSCPVCFEPFDEKLQRMVTMCGHMFCEPCISEVARTIKKCPTCRKSVTTKKYHAIYI